MAKPTIFRKQNQLFTNNLVITVTPVVTPSVTITSNATSVCSGDQVFFTANAFNLGNSGTYQWLLNGLPIGQNSPNFTTNSLSNGDQVSVQINSSLACATSATALSNVINMVVNPTLVPSASIVASSNNICNGDNVTFTLTPGNQGPSPSYEWFINGIAQNVNSTTFSASTLNNGDVINAIVYSSEVCATPPSTSSNNLVITVSPLLTPSVNITANTDSICSGTQVLFTANAVNLGNSGSYQWFVNGLPVGQNSAIYTSSTLNDGDEVNVEITSSLSCVANPSVSSAPIEMTVVPTVQPSISITASDVNICGGETVTFTSLVTNPGTNPVYNWYINGILQPVNSPIFVFSNFSNGDVVSAILESSTVCATPAAVSSNNIVMTVGPVPATPSVNISANQTNICYGTYVLFTASSQFAGSNPIYQWFLNGSPVAGNSPTFSSNDLNNGDQVSLTLTSDELCVTSSIVNSDTIVMVVEQVLSPQISITASNNNICSGTGVDFTATIQNVGPAPTIEWFVNGVAQNINNTLFSSTSLNNSDIVSAIVISSLACSSPTVGSSNNISMAVIPTVTPAISISASDTTICNGTNILFTSSATNPGTNPAYQWYVNNAPIGNNSPVFSSTTLSNGDDVKLMLYSSEACATIDSVLSNVINITVTAATTPVVSIVSSASSICAGDTVMFSSNVINAGQSPSFEWFINGAPQGINNDTLFTSSLSNASVINLIVTSSDVCATIPTVTSNNLVMTVNPIVFPQLGIEVTDSLICEGSSVLFTSSSAFAGSQPFYQWFIDGNPVGPNANVYTTTALFDSANVQLMMLPSFACPNTDTVFSNVINIRVKPTIIPSVFISTPDISICDGDTALFIADVSGVPLTTVSYSWELNGQPVAFNNSTYSYPAGNTGDVVSLTISTSADCAVPSSLSSNDVTMTVGSSDTMKVAISSTTGLLCEGTKITFVSSVFNGGSNPKYAWLLNGNLVGLDNSIYVSPELDSGDVVSLIVYSDNECSTNDTASSNILVITPSPEVNAGVDVTIFTGDSIQLIATGTLPGVYTWSPSWLLNDPNAPKPFASPTSTTEFTVTLTTAEGCSAEDKVVIIVKEGAGLYSSFTPNGDGINDVWIIENLEEYPTCTVEIFNRWGNQVFSSVGYAVPWDGTYKGEVLPFGVYYYIIRLHDDAEPLQGTVTILK